MHFPCSQVSLYFAHLYTNRKIGPVPASGVWEAFQDLISQVLQNEQVALVRYSCFWAQMSLLHPDMVISADNVQASCTKRCFFIPCSTIRALNSWLLFVFFF